MISRETVRRFVKRSALVEKAALNLYEAVPYHVRNRMLLGPAFIHWTMLLKESEGWDAGTFRNYQFEQIKGLLSVAAKHIPHYRKAFAEIGFDPDSVKDFEGLGKTPFLVREGVRDEPQGLVDERRPLSTLMRTLTSGSSGVPLAIYRDRAVEAAFLAFRTRILERAGYVPGKREVMFWPMVSLGSNMSLPYMRYGKKLILSIRHLTPSWLGRFVTMIADFNPDYIMGYPSVLAVVASFIKHEASAVFPRLRAVISYAENIYAWQRALVEEAFGGRVFSMYAMAECAVIGGECEQTSYMHLHPLFGYTELKDSAGGYKEIVATGFCSRVVPFIRYRTGDVVEDSTDYCPNCGRHHMVVGSLQGRIDDFLIGKDGEIIPRLMPWIKTFSNVLQFQFSQEEPGSAVLRIVKGEKYTAHDTGQIRLWLDNMLGIMKGCISIEIEVVDEIPLLPSGKKRMVSQKLDIRSFLKA